MFIIFPIIWISSFPSFRMLRATFSTASMGFLFISKNCILRTKFVAFMTMGFPCIFSRKAHSSHQIFYASNWFKMVWINTGAISAQMVNLKSIWNGFFEKFISKSMSQISFPMDHKFTISGTGIDAIKYPALRFWINPLNSFPKIFKFIEFHLIYICPCISTCKEIQ